TLRKNNQSGKKFYFLEGPPYTSGNIHLGHAWNMGLKDIILRYKRAQGFNVWDRMGYDMHGLPTEQKVMAKFNLKNKEDIGKFGLPKFMKECFNFCTEMMIKMNQDFQRLGATLDFTNPYQPITNKFMEAEWFLIKKAHENGRLYQGLRTMHWDAATQTAVAKHEIEYKKVRDTSIYVKFQDTVDSSKYYLIWTTTPWTIPLNLAIMANPDLDYVEIRAGKEILVMAKDLAEPVMDKIGEGNYRIKEEFKGRKLIGKHYIHPLEIKQYLPEELQKNSKLFTIVSSKEYVDTSAGTGLVHCAPGCGPEDYEVGHLNHIPPFNCVNEEGYFENLGQFSGLAAKIDDPKFIEAIDKSGALLAKEPYFHDYPHGERSHQPVIFRTTKQWFFKVEDLKQKMLRANKSINWNPPAAKNAYTAWLENLRDNSITKQRYWGTPVPIWQAEDDDYIVVGSLAELEKLSGKKVENMHLPEIDQITIIRNNKIYRRIADVLDVWIDAGTTSWNCLDYPNNTQNFDKYFPADFILEGKDQIRGWFNLLMIASMLAFDKPSFKNVTMHGFVTDMNGVKMSKSLGNIISPDEIIDKHGADVLRYYMNQTAAGEDINFSGSECKIKERQLNILWNIHKLLVDLSKENNFNPSKFKPKNFGIEEKYILSKLNSTLSQVTELLDNYHLDEIIKPIEDLFLELSRTYIQMTRDKSSSGSEEDKQICIYTIYNVILEILKMFQLVAPFISEAIYLNLKEEFDLPEKSISHYQWSKINHKLIDKNLEREIEIAQDLTTASLNAREKIKRSLRWPVKEIIVISSDPKIKQAVKEMQGILKTQTNSKSVIIKEKMPKVEVSVTANPGAIGPVHGKLSPKIIQEINKSGKVLDQCKVDGQEIAITPAMLNINRTVPPGYADAESKYGLIYLSTESSEDLEAEGYARELTRNIQQARKTTGLKKTDKI
ncbi:MAG TPA: isoleucine--tRNA ligase, partial [Candidatus Nanoarchaeia archaeon]|nr:isoleucine--tRNA ligase [Candidatus Nanoarchaeia archaeon]